MFRAILLIALLVACPALADEKPLVLFLIGEDEYDTAHTLPEFAKQHLGSYSCEFVHGSNQLSEGFPGIERLKDAHLLVMSVRRRTLPKAQMAFLRAYVDSGKPIIALRTTSHGFALREGKPPEGHEVWSTFDRDVLGCRYNNHHGNKNANDPRTFVWVDEKAIDHPIMKGVDLVPGKEFHVKSWLYRSEDLAEDAQVLLRGRVEGREPSEPVAWARQKQRRLFYTSLGHEEDFKLPQFQDLLKNVVEWSLKK